MTENFLVNTDEVVPLLGDRYYEVDELSTIAIGSKKLIIFQQNIRSFNRNSEYFLNFIDSLDFKVDVIMLTETWFSDIYCGDMEGYYGYHTFRTNGMGGGVSIYVRGGIRSCLNVDRSVISGSCEACVVDLYLPTERSEQKVTILALYRPPTSSSSLFIDFLNEITETFSAGPVLIGGDLNIDLLNDTLNSDLISTMLIKSFLPLINLPTRVTENTATCLDHLWYNGSNMLHSGSVVTDVSDHYSVFCILDIATNKSPIRKTIRVHNECNIGNLVNSMPDFVASYMLFKESADVNGRTEWFLNNLWSLYDGICPKVERTLSHKKISKPWITESLTRDINFKHALFKRYKQGIVDFPIYNNYKNILTKKLKKAKSDYFQHKFNEIKMSSRDTWKSINGLLNRTKKKSDTILENNGIDTSNPGEISEIFVDYFSSIANDLNNDIPLSNINPLNYLPNQVGTNFQMHLTSREEVVDIVSGLPNKGANINTIPIFVYKKLIEYIADIIVDIFNCSVTSGIFPATLKNSRVVPLFKSKSPKLVNNYRPISTLSVLSKIIEKIMKKRVVSYLEDNELICEKQYGFREGYNTSDAILEFTDICAHELDNRKFTIAVFLDLSKAFDTVNRQIMVSKLRNFGFVGADLNWFDGYLCDRKMYVDVNNSISSVRTLNIGLPQGSVSSPYLFSIYVNDMHRCSDRLSFVHFADDTTVFMSGDCIEELCLDISVELGKVSEWLRANRLSLNIDKTSFILFTHAHIERNYVSVSVGNHIIDQVNDIRFLGIQLDSRLNFNEQVNKLCKKLARVVGMMRKLRNLVPPHVTKSIYYSLFQSLLSYCIVIFGGCGKTNRDKLSKIVDRAQSLLHESVQLPMSYDNLYLYHLLTQFHKYLTGPISSRFQNRINDHIPRHTYPTRHITNSNLMLPSVNKTTSKNQFFFNAIKHWNKLPGDIKLINERDKFKKTLKSWLKNV